MCVPNVHTTVYCAQPGWEGGYAWGGQESHYRWGLLLGRVAGCCERSAQQVHDGLVEGKEA